jgi:hypothetical protein
MLSSSDRKTQKMQPTSLNYRGESLKKGYSRCYRRAAQTPISIDFKTRRNVKLLRGRMRVRLIKGFAIVFSLLAITLAIILLIKHS